MLCYIILGYVIFCNFFILSSLILLELLQVLEGDGVASALHTGWRGRVGVPTIAAMAAFLVCLHAPARVLKDGSN